MYGNNGLQKPSKAWDLLQLTRIVDYELLSYQNTISSCAKCFFLMHPLSFKDAPWQDTSCARPADLQPSHWSMCQELLAQRNWYSYDMLGMREQIPTFHGLTSHLPKAFSLQGWFFRFKGLENPIQDRYGQIGVEALRLNLPLVASSKSLLSLWLAALQSEQIALDITWSLSWFGW